MSNIDIRIMAVKRRREKYVLNELQQFNRSEDAVFYDDRPNGGYPTYGLRKCLEANHGDATHVIIAQDDIDICNNFETIVNKAISIFPDAIWSFHNPYVYIKDIKNIDTPYVVICGNNCLGACLCIPTKYVQDILAFLDLIPLCIHSDCPIGMYAKKNKIPIMTTVPSTVNHLGLIDSSLGHNNYHNTTKTWIGRDIDEFNWDSNEYNVVYRYVKWRCEARHKICKDIKNVDKETYKMFQ